MPASDGSTPTTSNSAEASEASTLENGTNNEEQITGTGSRDGDPIGYTNKGRDSTENAEFASDSNEKVNKGKKESLNDDEQDTLKKCEDTLRKSKKPALAMGFAMRKIRDQRLYRVEYKSIREYLEKKWGISRSFAYSLMDYSEVCEKLSATADKCCKTLPTERQARYLIKIKDDDKMLAAWKLAKKYAGKHEVKQSHVVRAVDEIMKEGPNAEKKAKGSNPRWVQSRVKALTGAGYLTTFVQPLNWGDVTADIHCEAEDVYLKFINKVDVPNAMYAMAIKKAGIKSYCIVNGEANQCFGVEPQDGEGKGLSCPHLNYFAVQAGVFVEYRGIVYEPNEVGSDMSLVWRPATDSFLVDIVAKSNGCPQKVNPETIK